MNDCPMTASLLAARRSDLAGIRVQLDQLDDDDLLVLRAALWDVATELRFTLLDRGCDMSALPLGDVSRDGYGQPRGRRCSAASCHRLLTSARSRYCSGACRMRALRQRRALSEEAYSLEQVEAPRPRRADHCVYECTSCGERFLGEQRCPDCNLYARNLGLGAPCPDCDHPIVLAELLPIPGSPATTTSLATTLTAMEVTA